MSPLRIRAARVIPILIASALPALPLTSIADTLILTSGEKFDCTILEETDSYVKVEYNVTASIKDEKKFPIAQIVKVIKLPADQLAFAKIQALLPTPDLIGVDEYNDLIDNHVRLFLTSFPSSHLTEDAGKILTDLVGERDKVLAGGRKFEGKWLTALQFQQEKYNIESKQLLARVKEFSDKGDPIKAFRALNTIEAKYSGSLQYPAAIEAIKAGFPKFNRTLEKLAIEQPLIQQRRVQGLASLLAQDHTRAKDAIDKEIAHHEALHLKEKEADIVWQSVYKYDLESITRAQTQLAKDTERLLALDTQGLVAGAALAAKANEAIAVADFTSATKLIDQAREQGGDETYLAQLEGDIVDIRAQQEVDASAAAAAQLLEEEKNATMATLAAVTSVKEEPEEEEIIEETEAVEEAKPEEAPEPKPSATPEVAPPAPPSGGGFPFRAIIVGVGLIFLIVTGVAKFLQKKKAEEEG